MIQPHQFKVRENTNMPFKPANQDFNRSFSIFLNSQDKISGTNDEAQFLVQIPDTFKNQRLSVSIPEFYINTPTGASNSIVHVDLKEMINPYSYSSSNKNIHTTIATLPFNSYTLTSSNIIYPISPLTGYANTIGGELYTCSNSSVGVAGYEAWRAFDLNPALHWISYTTAMYTGSNYSGAQSTTIDSISVGGEWIQIGLPNAITLSNYVLSPSKNYWTNQAPKKWYLAGSMDGSSWTGIDYRQGQVWSSCNMETFTPSNTPQPFKNYRLVINEVNGNGFVSIGELRLFGHSNTQLTRIGGQHHNNTFTQVDKTIFQRPITIKLTSPNVPTSSLSNWSCRLVVEDDVD